MSMFRSAAPSHATEHLFKLLFNARVWKVADLDLSTVQFAVQAGADVTARKVDPALQSTHTVTFGQTPIPILHLALNARASYDVIKLLLEHGAYADVNTSINDWTPLRLALRLFDAHVFELLIAYGYVTVLFSVQLLKNAM